jgi:hypothetical protein
MASSTKVRVWTTGLVLLLATVAGAQQKDTPVGKVSIESKTIAAGVGVSWGDGKLTYQGKDYPFSISGLSVADVGIAKVSATGDVYNLKTLSEFSGNYVAGQAGMAVGGGAGGVAMQNQNGVVIQLTATGTGVKFTLGPKGVDVKLKQ